MWLTKYVQRLTQDANEQKLAEIFQWLSSSSSSSSGAILGLPRRQLLSEMLRVASTNPALQRLVLQFHELSHAERL
jgi:hypothetical protein